MFTLPLSGISTALFPIRDINLLHVRQQFAANLLFSRFAPRQNAARSGQNCHPHPTKDARNSARANVSAQSRAAHPPQPCDGARTVSELVRDLDLWMRSARINRVVRDVTFIFQDARDLSLNF